MKTKEDKIHNLYLELKQESQKAIKIEDGSPYDIHRKIYLPDFFKRRAMELDIARRAKPGRLLSLCESWESRAIKLFQKVDKHDDPDCSKALLLQEMGEIYCNKSGELRLSCQTETVFELMLNKFRKYAKRPGAGRF